MHDPAGHRSLIDRIHQRGFNAVYQRSLLYNACWEDPALDREAMQLQPDDRMVMITSAGCNALDYAIDGPATIDCIDANPHQTALLELKLAGIRGLDYEDFFSLFGSGYHPDMRELYRHNLRDQLSTPSRQFWDDRMHWWDRRGWRQSFYFYGLSGIVARSFQLFINRRPKLHQSIRDLLEVRDLETQREMFYEHIAPRLFGPTLRWLLGRQMVMNMLGVPREQGLEVKASHQRGVAGFVESSIEAVCSQLPFHQNYFWRVYLTGHYEPECCPRYLTPEGFSTLRGGNVNCIRTHTTTVAEHLRQRDADSVDKFVLLDHMDWMGNAYPEALGDEWREIFRSGTSDCQILFRSGAVNPGFLRTQAPFGDDRRLDQLLTFDTELADRLHPLDRVHTYASFHIATPSARAC